MIPRRTAWLSAASFWAIFGLVTGGQVWISMSHHGHSVPLLLGYHLAIWEGWLLPTALVVRLARRWPVAPPRATAVLVHVAAASVVGVLHAFYWIGLLIVLRPFDRMTPPTSRIDVPSIVLERLPLELVLYCGVLGSAVAFDYYGRYRERVVQAAQLEASLAEARLRALELQIQPHFLFNTMNSISALVRNRRNDEAVEMIAGLCELLRYTLDHAGEARVALHAEVLVLRRYLEIQRVRFPDRMSFQIDVSPEAMRGVVPTLLLQPLAENAVRHGIALHAAKGEVSVRAFREGERLRIEVWNTGTLQEGGRAGIGLSNTRERLRHLYGDAWALDVASAKGGVLASVSVPWCEVGDA